MESDIYGGFNYPFVSTSVARYDTNVDITPNITANNNTVNINNSVEWERRKAYH
ncbi:MAG: hypothetical protein LBG23_03930 [Endomicrobium sp.]|nr:hypothetical protein [Endomicrobium sp.]